MDITLVKAVFGMGNTNQAHVHRHNTLNLDSQTIDRLKMEQLSAGGVLGTTLNEAAFMSGGVSARPQGMVSIEDGWNIRRGIGMLKFSLEHNAITSSELVILGYMVGGSASMEGIAPETLFVPVRSWTTGVTNVTDGTGMPMAKAQVVSSSQFLMGDPYQVRNLQAMRPVDVGNQVLGLTACEKEGNINTFDGVLGGDLNKTVIVSKTHNLNPTHHAKELLKIATNVTASSGSVGLEYAMSDSLASVGIREIHPTQNEFFQAMAMNLGIHMFEGFQGFSVEEINNVFTNLPDVMSLDLLNPSFEDANNLLNSAEHGNANMHEIVFHELSNLTVHLLMQAGLTHLTFSATNNPQHINGLIGSEDGVEIIPGEFGSVFEHDDGGINRVERFKELLKSTFFSKYTTGYMQTTTIIDVVVSCALFGETIVEVSINSGPVQRKVMATYCINRTSTNIAGKEVGMDESKNFMYNIRDYFAE